MSDDVVRGIQDLRQAEARLSRRRQASRALGDLDLAAIRAVVEAAVEGRDLTPTELAERLQVSSASVTALLRRLEAGGRVALRANPADRRSKFVVPLDGAGGAGDPVSDGVARAAVALTDGERAVVARFLRRVVDEVDAAWQPEMSGR